MEGRIVTVIIEMTEITQADIDRLAVEKYKKKILKRIEGKVEPITETGCYIWTASSYGGRYGNIYYRGKVTPAHRVVWTILNGDIPSGMSVCHKCDIGFCVNPEHLFLGTHQENMIDMVKKGRNVPGGVRGEKNYLAKLTEKDVRQIKTMVKTLSMKKVSMVFGVSESCINQIKRGVSWKHVN